MFMGNDPSIHPCQSGNGNYIMVSLNGCKGTYCVTFFNAVA